MIYLVHSCHLHILQIKFLTRIFKEAMYTCALICLGLASFVNALTGSCPPITFNDLGSTTELSTAGLVARNILPSDAELSLVPTRINRFAVLCEAPGKMPNTLSYVSVLVEFQCSYPYRSGKTANCDGVMKITAQLHFSCSFTQVPRWIDVVFSSNQFIMNRNPTATFTTTPDTECSSCVDPRQLKPDSTLVVDPDTHCASKYFYCGK